MAKDSVSAAVAEVEAAEDIDEQDEKKTGGLLGILRRSDEDEDAEHEIEFSTPFGKFELEFEPTTKKARRDRKNKERQEREAAKKAAELAVKARREAERALAKRISKEAKKGSVLGKIALVLVIFAVVGGAIAVAYWLFGRRPEELEAENVPPEYRAVDVAIAPAEPEGFMPKMRERLRRAVSAGRRASAEAQIEQQARYEDLTRPG